MHPDLREGRIAEDAHTFYFRDGTAPEDPVNRPVELLPILGATAAGDEPHALGGRGGLLGLDVIGPGSLHPLDTEALPRPAPQAP